MGRFLCIAGMTAERGGKGPPPGAALRGRGMIQGKNAVRQGKCAVMLTDGLFLSYRGFPKNGCLPSRP